MTLYDTFSNPLFTLDLCSLSITQVFDWTEEVSAAELHLQNLLPKLAAVAGVPSLSYVSIQNQGNYMVELPASRMEVPQGWGKVCGTKQVCRYHPLEVKEGMAALARAQEHLAAATTVAWQQLLADFSAQHHAACREAVSAVAQLDALLSLAQLAATPDYCRPQFVEDDQPAQLVISDGKHPMLDLALDGRAVPNSLELRWDGVRAAVITGPNMGGKSVLIRQAALTIIMAQLGSWVPATACQLSVFDGVFSRMGATDCLLQGRSTFAEELGDASHILASATNRSLVIMDELGRGTATHDGVAIATATLGYLVTHKQCLTLFVTHYPEVAALARHGSSDNSSGGTSSSDDSGARPAAAPATVDTANAAAAAAGSISAGADTAATKEPPSSSGSSGVLHHHVAVYHMSYVRHDPAPSEIFDPNTAAVGAVKNATTQNVSVPVITFLYKLAAGAADESFGLNVAQVSSWYRGKTPHLFTSKRYKLAICLSNTICAMYRHYVFLC
eukprot:GHRR01032389.1.p1 GENE.GHRR01032389.1~~GHRR01032389.1.p1  ORF type:complete len:502 (+),score=204.36 GHRR01032389.1:576-2081(+)